MRMNNLGSDGCAGGMRCKVPVAQHGHSLQATGTQHRAHPCSQNVLVIHGQSFSTGLFRDMEPIPCAGLARPASNCCCI